MILSGFTDEASTDLDVQIKATKELGWEYLSARTIGDKNIHDIDEDAFDMVCNKLEDNGIKVAEFGTLIGNWSKSIYSDWKITVQEIKRCIPRMHRLDVRYARIMSYAQLPWGEDQLEQERFKRLREICKIFTSEGLTALHENCMNWGGFSADHTLRLLEEVPGMKLVFDTGNPISQKDRSKSPSYPWQDSLEFYQKVKDHILHIHIKDAIMDDVVKYTFPGEGLGHIPAILQDLKSRDFQGFVAIEPHMGKIFHESSADKDDIYQYQVYIEYGKMLEDLIKDL